MQSHYQIYNGFSDFLYKYLRVWTRDIVTQHLNTPILFFYSDAVKRSNVIHSLRSKRFGEFSAFFAFWPRKKWDERFLLPPRSFHFCCQSFTFSPYSIVKRAT